MRFASQPFSIAHCRAFLWSKPLLPSDNRLAGRTTGGAAGRCGIFAAGATRRRPALDALLDDIGLEGMAATVFVPSSWDD
jgi:hypothetical protein